MANGCMDCRRREEDMYWSHFQTVQFCQILSGQFDQKLAIPKKFTNNVREKLAGTVTLKGPSGHNWDVGLTTNGDTSVLRQGWKAFIEDHFLEENDILIFKYNGNSSFDVSMFDQSSLCEKEASYFVKKCEHTEIESGCKRKRNTPRRTEDTDELFNESSDDVVEYHPVKKPRNDAAKTPMSSRLATGTNAKLLRGKKKVKRGSSNSYGYQLQLTSLRRAVTEEEKETAKEKAKAHAASLENSFILVMRPTHVYKGFFMCIPSEWSRVHLPQKTQQVVIRLNEKSWKAKYHRTGFGGRLISGWKNFVLDNFLEEFDVCSFHLASRINDGVILDVSIFRVVEDVIPPSCVPRASQGRVVRGRLTKTLRNRANEADDE
ncbi:B3 domain-containing REM16 [Olea europaea subsp. europaea]|uniref:B3 domain-containing REM16 n=1 Tax=Olea europaea subsp. europaea TaxID=158383 RepID=A0A8S0TTT1_OLEEU|nr:B3 domain-containing REM16 [Olea europaea subsp. europaea]